jgi:hypothetical protein
MCVFVCVRLCVCVFVCGFCVCVCKITAQTSEILKIRNEINPKTLHCVYARLCVFVYFVFVLAFLCLFMFLCVFVCVFHSVSFCTTERHVKVRKLKYFAKHISTTQISTSNLYRELQWKKANATVTLHNHILYIQHVTWQWSDQNCSSVPKFLTTVDRCS